MSEFSIHVSEYAKTNNNLRLDINYNSLETAKRKTDEHFWLQDKNACFQETEQVVFSLEQAKWLVEQLQYFIKLIEE